MTTLYMTGYNGTTRTKEQLLEWSHVKGCEPMFWRRILGIMDASIIAGRPLGIGSITRGKIEADNLFLSRYYMIGSQKPGAISFNGAWYMRRAGQSPAMPGDRTYHVRMTPKSAVDPNADGTYALAVDFTGNIKFLYDHAAEWHLIEFSKANGEGWHAQPKEIPTSRRSYRYGAPYDPIPWVPLPGDAGQAPLPTPQPLKVFAPSHTIKQRRAGEGTNDKAQTRALQHQCNFWGWRDSMGRTLIVDGIFASKSEQALRTMQRALGILDDGVYGPKTEARFQRHLDAMVAL